MIAEQAIPPLLRAYCLYRFEWSYRQRTDADAFLFTCHYAQAVEHLPCDDRDKIIDDDGIKYFRRRDRLDYGDIADSLRAQPPSFYPALLKIVCEEAHFAKTFRPGGMIAYVERIEHYCSGTRQETNAITAKDAALKVACQNALTLLSNVTAIDVATVVGSLVAALSLCGEDVEDLRKSSIAVDHGACGAGRLLS